jgi:hypothetical protein
VRARPVLRAQRPVAERHVSARERGVRFRSLARSRNEAVLDLGSEALWPSRRSIWKASSSSSRPKRLPRELHASFFAKR